MRFLLNTARYSVLLGVLGLGLMGCNRGDGDPDDSEPIVVEENGPIALGDGDPSEDEIDVIDEDDDDRPVIIRERTVVREVPVNRPSSNTSSNANTPAPSRVSSIPAGTHIPVSLLAQIDSEHNNVGDSWTGRVTRDVVVGGRVVIPGGATVSGVVSGIDEGDATGQGSVTLDARSVETVSGTRSIAAAPVSGGHSYGDKGFPARETAIGAGAGAAIGAAIGGKKGAAIGAAAGGAGGAAMGSARNDQEVALNAGTVLTIRLESSVTL
ncbi:MAG: hypothetical protein ABR559_00890 [Gemmatimonadota bacterium]